MVLLNSWLCVSFSHLVAPSEGFSHGRHAYRRWSSYFYSYWILLIRACRYRIHLHNPVRRTMYSSASTKTLRLQRQNEFQYFVPTLSELTNISTKRSTLQTFWIAGSGRNARQILCRNSLMLLHELRRTVRWSIGESKQQRWLAFRSGPCGLDKINRPRKVHEFSNASGKAYRTCFYLRTVSYALLAAKYKLVFLDYSWKPRKHMLLPRWISRRHFF